MTFGSYDPASSGARAIAAGLHFVATPIGAARDITLRALDTLAGADVLAAEDTRTLRHLMEIHGIPLNGRQVVAYHDHNGAAARPKLLRALQDGKSVAYASEAGTPLVADPGYQLARAAIDAGVQVLAAPGASAVLYALTVSGLPTDRFMFVGFPPATQNARQTFLKDCAKVQATLVMFESPKRINRLLTDLVQTHGAGRKGVVCRELTKRFEDVVRGTLGDLAADFAARDVRGEIVVLVDRGDAAPADPGDVNAAMKQALGIMSVKDAAAMVADQFGLQKREAYQLALKLGDAT
jgi:16S rRNA (cytidine1402-2'-O)-methyltransferase